MDRRAAGSGRTLSAGERPRDVTARFGDRAEAYARHRPDYPEALDPWLRSELGIGPGTRAADLGAGTGIFTRRLLDLGCAVWAIEPNDAMREALARDLADRDALTVVAGRAEATTLADASVDLVAAAQAFHWFEREPTRREIARIARPGARFLFVWNHRLAGGAPFREAYERFLREWGIDYDSVRGTYEDELAMRALARDGDLRLVTFDHRQLLDRGGLRGRARSTSYLPGPDHPDHEPMLAALDELFSDHAEGGVVSMDYETRGYWGEVAGPQSPVAGS